MSKHHQKDWLGVHRGILSVLLALQVASVLALQVVHAGSDDESAITTESARAPKLRVPDDRPERHEDGGY